jgi:hypothetical protein
MVAEMRDRRLKDESDAPPAIRDTSPSPPSKVTQLPVRPVSKPPLTTGLPVRQVAAALVVTVLVLVAAGGGVAETVEVVVVVWKIVDGVIFFAFVSIIIVIVRRTAARPPAVLLAVELSSTPSSVCQIAIPLLNP